MRTINHRFSRANLERPIHNKNTLVEKKCKRKEIIKRRRHIDFKIEIKTKLGINTVIDFLNKDIKKRLYLDKKYKLDNNECHLKHLNFIFMEILLKRVLEIFKVNYNMDSIDDEEGDIKNKILYVPDKSYVKDLTIISRVEIDAKYERMYNQESIDEIANYIYTTYKSFGFINLNFLKRKIYEFV